MKLNDISVSETNSIDLLELKKFESLSDEWWDVDGKFKILHQINPIRLSFIKSKILDHFKVDLMNEAMPSKIDLIDVGCGGGIVSEYFARMKNISVVGIDVSQSSILCARQHATVNSLNINYLCEAVEVHVAHNKEKYDVVLCLEMIEHVTNLQSFISNLTKLLKPTGMIIIATFNRNIKSFILGIIAAEKLLKWVPSGTHNYSKFVKPSELYRLLLENNCTIKELKGLTFNPWKNNWRLTDDINVNYFAYATRY